MNKTRRPWQPRIENEPLFNPFVPSTEVPPDEQHTRLTDEDEPAAPPDDDSSSSSG